MREGEGYSRRRVRSVQVTKGSNMGFICTAITKILPLPKFFDYRQTLQLFIVDGATSIIMSVCMAVHPGRLKSEL